jgi:hypothetical protein
MFEETQDQPSASALPPPSLPEMNEQEIEDGEYGLWNNCRRFGIADNYGFKKRRRSALPIYKRKNVPEKRVYEELFEQSSISV